MSQGMSSDRVAFFGGSFDPPHAGHLAVARAARAALGLDLVLFAPVGAQPLKPVGATASYEDRVAMTRLAIAGESGFGISLADAPRADGTANYTVETLEALKKELGPGCSLFCLLGADSFVGLRLWHRAADIPFVAPLIVASRPGEDLGDLKKYLPAGLSLEEAVGGTDLPDSDVEVECFSIVAGSGRWAETRAPLYLLPAVDVPISATRIRELVRTDAVDDALPEAVKEFVEEHGLYR